MPTDKKQQYLDTAKALEALGDSALADACRAKAESIPEEKENEWVAGSSGVRYRISRDQTFVSYADYRGEPYRNHLLTPDAVRGLAKQLGMIDPKALSWGVVGRSGRGEMYCSTSWRTREFAITHAAQAGLSEVRIFQHLPSESIK
jgi:hypothetical protein